MASYFFNQILIARRWGKEWEQNTVKVRYSVSTVADLGGGGGGVGGFGGQACTLFLGLTKGRKNIFSRLPPLSWGLSEQAPHFTLRFESGSVVVEISRLVHITQNSNAERLNDMKMSEYGVSVLIILLLMQTIPSVKLQVFIMCTS